MSYSYDPLPRVLGAIRVFTLLPSPNLDAPFHGQIQHEMRREGNYIAISYVWGDPNPHAALYIDEMQLRIGKNLSEVLRNIRDDSKPLDLWIDAICINQSDEGEKSAQVQDMANVYKDADEVIGWVGEPVGEAYKGFRLFRELTDRHDDEDFGEFLEHYIGNVSNDEYWIALVDLLDRPYWNRLWILQEVSVNPRITLRFGRDPEYKIKLEELFEWDWIRFEVVSKWREHRGDDSEGSIINRFDSTLNSVYNIGYIPDLCPLTVEELQPFLLSSLCGGSVCSNPLDYIFGLIGLFEAPPVTVDYGTAPRKLFLDVLESVQHRTQKLDFLSWAWGNYSYSTPSPHLNPYNMPAWAVDWSWRTRWVSPIPLANSKDNQRILFDTFYAASGESKSRVGFNRYNDVLTVKGCEVSTVVAVGSLADPSSSTIWPKDWSSIAEQGSLEAPQKDPALRSGNHKLNVWHTGDDHSVMADKGSENHSAMTYKQLDTWWRVLFGDTLSREQRIDPPVPDQQAVPPTNRNELEDLCRHLTEYLQIRVHDGRRMFRTTDGRLGLAPPRAKPGDVVCVLLGGDVPYLLRRLQHEMGECRGLEHEIGGYQFVGEWCVLLRYHDRMGDKKKRLTRASCSPAICMT